MLTLIKRKGRKNWYMRGTVGGEVVFESTGTHSREHAEFICAEENKRRLDRSVFGARATATFLEAAVSYMEVHSERRFIQPLIDHFGSTPLRNIGQSEIDRLASQCKRAREPKDPDAPIKPLGKATLVRQIYTPMISILRHAAKSGLCDMPMIQKPKVPQPAVEPTSDDWITKLVAASPDSLKALVLLMTFTGARVSEALRIEVRDVDLQNMRVLLKRTKNGKPRRVSINSLVAEALQKIMPDAGKVFPYSSRFGVYSTLKRACKRAKIEYRPTHAWGRHAFAARLLADGATLGELQKLGGWDSIAMPARIYGHLEQDRLDQLASRQTLRTGANKIRAIKGK